MRRAPAAIVVLVVAWGSTFAAIKTGLDSAPPLAFAGLRTLGCGVVMVAAAAVLRHRPRWRDWPAYVGLTMLNVVGFIGLQTLAIRDLPSGLAAVLIYLQPVLVGLLAWPILGERLTPTKLAGLLLGFSGIVAVSSGALTGSVSLRGVGFAVASAVAWALGTVYFKRIHEGVPSVLAIGLPFLGGGVLLSLAGLLWETGDVEWTLRFASALSYTIVVGTVLAWVLWFRLVATGEASRAAAYVFFVPLVSLVIGALFLDEPLSVSLLVGAALVVTGIFLVNRHPSAGVR